MVTDVRGMNNKGQFVGTYAVQVGIDQFYGSPIYEHHGYIATPAPQRKPAELLGPAISLNLSQSYSTGSAALTAKSPVRDLIRVKHSNFGKQFLESLTPE